MHLAYQNAREEKVWAGAAACLCPPETARAGATLAIADSAPRSGSRPNKTRLQGRRKTVGNQTDRPTDGWRADMSAKQTQPPEKNMRGTC